MGRMLSGWLSALVSRLVMDSRRVKTAEPSTRGFDVAGAPLASTASLSSSIAPFLPASKRGSERLHVFVAGASSAFWTRSTVLAHLRSEGMVREEPNVEGAL
jgi:hypothetical protein